MKPLVSVIIPVYNRESTIQRALDSVLNQSYTKLEIIVVDDGSSDKTVEVVKGYKDERVKLICLKQNGGANAARNKGICAAKGEYIAFQDSDDEWLEDKLLLQIKHMQEKDKEVCYSSYILYEGNGTRVIPDNADNIELYEDSIREVLKRGNVIPTPTLVIHRKAVEKAGVFDEALPRLQDYEYAIRLAQYCKVGYISRPLVKAYRMSVCISNDNGALLEAYRKILVKHIDYVDMQYILQAYFWHSEIFNEKEVQWEEMDILLRELRVSGNSDLEAVCYRTAMQCIQMKYYREKSSLVYWYRLFTEILVDNEFVIYGAGKYGEEAYQYLKKEGYTPKCFWVTKKSEVNAIDGIPVLELPESIAPTTPVIIAIAWEKQNELIKNLLDRENRNFCIYPYCR